MVADTYNILAICSNKRNTWSMKPCVHQNNHVYSFKLTDTACDRPLRISLQPLVIKIVAIGEKKYIAEKL